MPRNILEPYFKYIDSLQSAYQVGKNIGVPKEDGCSIPQGCPFSMTMVALLMRPWVMLIEELEVTPRVLADDLLVYGHGP